MQELPPKDGSTMCYFFCTEHLGTAIEILFKLISHFHAQVYCLNSSGCLYADCICLTYIPSSLLRTELNGKMYIEIKKEASTDHDGNSYTLNRNQRQLIPKTSETGKTYFSLSFLSFIFQLLIRTY